MNRNQLGSYKVKDIDVLEDLEVYKNRDETDNDIHFLLLSEDGECRQCFLATCLGHPYLVDLTLQYRS